MRFYSHQHQHYCGIDLHVKTMDVCILDATGQVLVHRNVPSTPAAFLATVWPYRTDLVVAAEGITVVLGHALAMKAIHGGTAKNDTIDSHTIAVLLRGGLVPHAYVYPAAMRSTRDLLRRRLHLVRTRGERLAYPGNREGVVEHVSEPSVRKSIEVDVTLIDQDDALVNDLALRRQEAGDQRGRNGECASQVGLLRSRRALSAPHRRRQEGTVFSMETFLAA